jgi:hypothetical protein
MASLSEILDNANGGEAISVLGRELDLTPEQTQSAVTALLPALSSGLKQSTSTVEGLGNLFALMGQQKDLPALFDDAKLALSPDGLAAGNLALSVIFGSPEVTQAVVDQAQKFSGVSSSILQKILPALAGIVLSGLMRSGSSASAPLGAQAALSPFGAGGGLGDILGQVFGRVLTGATSAPAPSSGGAGPLGDILGQIFGKGGPGSGGAPAGPAPSSEGAGPLGDILGQIFGKGEPGSGGATAGPAPQAPSWPTPAPADTGGGQAGPGGDLLGTIMREVLKGIQNGTIKPVIIGGGGPIQIPMPGGQDGSGAPQIPGGDIFGKILRDVLGGALGGGSAQIPQGGGAQLPGGPTPIPTQAPNPPMKDLSELTKQLGVMGGAGAAVFGDRLEHGQNVDQSHLDNIQGILDRFYGADRR